ncbi:MAG: bifunctional glutamate N-acetyltransferase/amino-acid acetyltransferase ArgJ [Nitrospira sp. SB0678_bin_10]|nr:bifunctional glutamate N-acetyltransferase/amino-acid acetyltransferase ArgJ [Nitrospira sp. SB0678_bin_10]
MKKITGGVTAPAGFLAAGIHAGIKPAPMLDLALLASTHPGTMAGVLTQNRIVAPPVLLCRRQLKKHTGQAIVINSGNANALTGSQGMSDAMEIRRLVSAALRLPVGSVFVGSTGVIGRPLPMPAIREAVPPLIRLLNRSGHKPAAQAIMTTDTRLKEVAVQAKIGGRLVTIGGMAKGSGMIHPDMATMLAYLTTDAAIAPRTLQAALTRAVNETFNCISVDGDTSTNDTVLCLANGRAGNPTIQTGTPQWETFSALLQEACLSLALQICRDGEGATKIVEIVVRGTRTNREAKKIAQTIATSLLVKTAVFGEDPNWGRIVAAAGRAGVKFNPAKIGLAFDKTRVVHNGQPVGDRADNRAQRVMRKKQYVMTLSLGNQPGCAKLWTTDLTYEYVRINASYTT